MRFRPARLLYFNPRPPRGGRPRGCASFWTGRRFQSTPSARRATELLRHYWYLYLDFNPRPPRGGRPAVDCHVLSPGHISIHALREEGDVEAWKMNICPCQFQSTPSARRATFHPQVQPDMRDIFQSTPSARRATNLARCGCIGSSISIHALREEGDVPILRRWKLPQNFNPRPPRGGRPRRRFTRMTPLNNFNPRPPRGGRRYITPLD